MDDLRLFDTDSSGLTPAQIKLLFALTTERTIADAAKKAGVSKASAFRWMKEPAFIEAQKAIELVTLTSATRSLLSLSAKAIVTLEGVLDDPDASASVRVRASEVVVTQLLRLRELVSHEERISALEAQLAEKGKRT